MTARPGEKARQGPKFLTDFVSKHFIEGERRSMRERLSGMLFRRSGQDEDESEERAG